MYFGENGPYGGQTEGGLQVQLNSNFYNNLSIQLYGRSTALPPPSYGPVTFPQHYACDTPIELVYGQLPSPNTGTFYTSASLPQYSPTTYQIPGGTVISYSVSYVFTNVPSDFNNIGQDGATGSVSPCYNCYMRRMDSIGQTSYNPYSGECFGGCNGYLSIRWDQVFMGETMFFSKTPQLITINMLVTPTAWFGGIEYLPNQNAVQHSSANYAQPYNFDYEGINLGGGLQPNRVAKGPFTIPLAALPLPVTTYLIKECFADPYPYGRYNFFAGDSDLQGRTVPVGQEIVDNVISNSPKICNMP